VIPRPGRGLPRLVRLGALCTLALSTACGGDDRGDGRDASSGHGSGTMDASVSLDGSLGGPDAADLPDTATGERAEEVYDGGVKRTFYWADWTSATTGADGGAKGSFALPSGSVQITFSGDLRGAQLEPSARNFWAINESYASATVEKAPDTTDALLIDGVLDGYGQVVFSRPVQDPVFAFASLGARGEATAASYRFDVPFLLLSQGKGFYKGDGWLEKQPNNTLSGQEANGVIGFQGTFSKISWTTPRIEPWHALTVGIAEDMPLTTPAPP